MVFACDFSQAQVVIKDWDSQLDDLQFRSMCLSAKEIILSRNNDSRQIGRADIFPLDEMWYLTMEGMFDVYKWENQKWINLYESQYWGYNFSSLKFINNGNLYSFGGNGFWKVHGEIIKFYPHARQWDILQSTSTIPAGLGLPGFDELFILRKDSLSIFDFKNEMLSTISLPHFKDSIPQFVNKKVIESKNFVLAINFHQFLLDKRNKSIHQRDRGAFIFIHGQYDGYYHVVGDSVIVYNNKLEFKMAELINLDQEGYQQIYPLNTTTISEAESKVNYFLVGMVLILLGAGGYIYFFRRKKAVAGSEELQQLVDQLIQKIGTTLSSDELDQALNIPEYLSPENARYKRSKLVNEINEYYKITHSRDLIVRIKDPDDKRKFFYKINS